MKDKKSKKLILEYWQVMAIFLICYDILSIHAAYFIALWLRFDFVFSRIPLEYYEPYCRFITWYSLGCVAVFWLFRMYRGMWSLAGVNEVLQVMEASVLTSIMHVILITVLLCRMPISYYVIGAVFQFGLLILLRLFPRFMSYERGRNRHMDETADRVMLIGAGAAGQMLLRDMQLNRDTNDKIVCVIDDNPNKWNRDIDGVPIVGGREDILTAVGRYHVNKIFFAIPSATAEQKRDILNICNETGCELKQLPGLYQFVLGQISVYQIILRLKRNELRPVVLFGNLLHAFQLPGKDRGCANVTCLATFHNVVQGFHDLLHRRICIQTVNLIQVDVIHAEAF